MAQLFEVLFADLRASKKHVNRLLTLGILFILVGHFYVVEPYFPYKAQERKLDDEEKSLKQQEQDIVEHLDNIKDVSQGVENTLTSIQKQINAYPAHLGEMRPKISKALQSGPSSAHLQFGEISLKPPIKTSEEGVRKYIEAWFTNLIEQIKNGVETEVSKLNSGQKGVEVSNLRDEADKATIAFKTSLEDLKRKNRFIFSRYEGAGEIATFQLQKVVVDSFDPVKKEVFGLLKITKDNLNLTKDALEDIRSHKVNLGKEREKLESRLNSLQSPLGPVPMGITDFIALFPLFIVALLVMITAALHKSCCLYLAFWHEFSKENTTMDRGAFQQFADCWYLPPYKSIVKLLLLIVLLAVVSGMFIRASLLVILNADAELFTFLFPGEESSTKSVYTGAYILGTLVSVGCFGIIFKTLRRITQKSIE